MAALDRVESFSAFGSWFPGVMACKSTTQ